MERLVTRLDGVNAWRIYFKVYGPDGLTPVTTEAAGQPQVSVNGNTWTGSNSIGTLTHVGVGLYYADLTTTGKTAALAAVPSVVKTRYVNEGLTCETEGDSLYVLDHTVTLLKAVADAFGARNMATLATDSITIPQRSVYSSLRRLINRVEVAVTGPSTGILHIYNEAGTIAYSLDVALVQNAGIISSQVPQ